MTRTFTATVDVAEIRRRRNTTDGNPRVEVVAKPSKRSAPGLHLGAAVHPVYRHRDDAAVAHRLAGLLPGLHTFEFVDDLTIIDVVEAC